MADEPKAPKKRAAKKTASTEEKKPAKKAAKSIPVPLFQAAPVVAKAKVEKPAKAEVIKADAKAESKSGDESEDARRRRKSCRKRFGVDDLVNLGKKPLKDLYAWVP